MVVRVAKFSVRSKAGALVLALAALALGGVFFLLGLALLATLGVAGLGLVLGTLLYRKLTGHSARRQRASDSGRGLDPALEVFSTSTGEHGQPALPRGAERLPSPKTLGDRGSE